MIKTMKKLTSDQQVGGSNPSRHALRSKGLTSQKRDTILFSLYARRSSHAPRTGFRLRPARLVRGICGCFGVTQPLQWQARRCFARARREPNRSGRSRRRSLDGLLCSERKSPDLADKIPGAVRTGIVASYRRHESPGRFEAPAKFPRRRPAIARFARGFFRSPAASGKSDERETVVEFVTRGDPARVRAPGRRCRSDAEAGPRSSAQPAGDLADVGLARIESEPNPRHDPSERRENYPAGAKEGRPMVGIVMGRFSRAVRKFVGCFLMPPR